MKPINNKIKMTLVIHIPTAIDRLIRDNNKAIYYNEKCISVLGGHEIKSISKILEALYEHHLEHKDKEKIPGLTQEQIEKATGLSQSSVGPITWKLTPQFINIRTDTKIRMQNRAKFHTLNEYGVMLVERLIEKENKKQEKQANV